MPGAPCPDSSDGEDPEDTSLLPPIGGIKAKRDAKGASQRTLKAAGAATLQKPGALALHGPQAPHPLGGALGSSKGLAAVAGSSKGLTAVAAHGLTSTGQSSSSTGVLHARQTMGHPWAPGSKDVEQIRSVLGSPCPPEEAADKMNSTWHASQNSRTKYVSPFGNNKVAREAGGSKKR
jgi:hypothetical protein